MAQDTPKLRILYLATSPVPPSVEPTGDRFFLLSQHLEGVVLKPSWYHTQDEVRKTFGLAAWPAFERGSFQYRWILTGHLSGIRRRGSILAFYIQEGLRVHREEPVDCIVVYSHMTTALCGLILKILTGAKLAVEVISSPDRVFIYDRPNAGLGGRLRKWYSDFCLHINLWSCDAAHLLYPWQLAKYPLLSKVKRFVFHGFVPVALVPPAAPPEKPVVLLMGAPWFLKGADLVIEAFLRLAPDFPEATLRIIGHFPDRADLMALASRSSQIEVLKAVHANVALSMIAESSIFVLASRCEGMGRVLLEAMSAGVPVIGSNVGGIPTLVRPGENGFLFPDGDVAELERHLRTLLSDPELREKLGRRGYEMAHTRFSEKTWVESFTSMVRGAVGRG